VAGGGALIAAPGTLAATAWAQTPGAAASAEANFAVAAWRELATLSTEAARLGISVPRMSASPGAAARPDYRQIMPATVDFIATLETAPPSARATAGQVDPLIEKSHDLLQRVHYAERNHPTDRISSQSLAVSPSRPVFESLKSDYETLFNACKIRDSSRSDVNWYVNQLLEARNQSLWVEAAKNVCCPWYFVGITHAMEAAFGFKAHLHNGDPIRNKTVQVPEGRPPQWNPPSDWVSSATDALTFDGFANQSDWSLPRMLYRWETYNGFRSRRNGINTPYLWSFSNHYSRGKYVADNVWDPDAVSKQCGAAVILKGLLERGSVALPS
jgi:lysozyme family protein